MAEEVITVTPKGDAQVDSKPLPPQQHISPIASFLGVSDQSPKDTEYLNYIYGEIRGESKEFNEGDALHKLRSIEQRLGAPGLSETRLGKIYNYFRAQENVRKAEKIRDAYLA